MTSKWFFVSAIALLLGIGAAAAKWEDHVNPHNIPLTTAQSLGVLGAAGLAAAGVKETLVESVDKGRITKTIRLLTADESPTGKECVLCYTAQVGNPDEYRHGYSFTHPSSKLKKLDDRLVEDAKLRPLSKVFPLAEETRGALHPGVEWMASLGKLFRHYEHEEPACSIGSYSLSDGNSRVTVMLHEELLSDAFVKEETSKGIV